MNKRYTVLLMVAVCAFASSPLELLADPLFTTATILIGEASITFRFSLEEGEIWPHAEALKDEYVLKSRFELSGWVVVIVQQAEQGGERG